MKKYMCLTMLSLCFAFVTKLLADTTVSNAAWKAGVAIVKITPEQPMKMAGYAARTNASQGVSLDLFAKALAIEDTNGTRLVMVTTDLIGIPRSLRDWMDQKVQEKYKLPRSALLLNASHTHSGPQLHKTTEPLPADASVWSRKSYEYTTCLQEKLLMIVGQALERLAPARIDYMHARCGFAMNRRRLTAKGYVNAPNSSGPVDHDVPVLRITSPDAKQLRVLLFGYACHNTTLGFLDFCGDYAGFAQKYIEEAHTNVTAMFMMGCGADQNPYPRSKLELCQQHGHTLATAVGAALETEPQQIRGPLSSALEEVVLDFAPPPSREELVKISTTKKGIEASHAKTLLKQLDKDGKIRTTYSYPIQVVHFGKDLLLIALAGETVVDYSLRLKRDLAGKAAVWVAGYSNDVFGYLPSLRVLREGGYEGATALLYGSLPGPFAESVEEKIVSKVHEMLR
ncbi:MAG: neutral/alkaline non-lysosomal ceramidase N-terminal domain-containing protein [Kiritimatiellae bacterium]|nr:neutral/alkaline non-lysosomal ceramidase N-terminal domain-containing protein [Kiritimatiellia bacterium]MDD5523337.1 neutral/alkaline non-lysosomal ceramidase N-terminal domain-containing protein [Kiritimatiellia bacterium]